ncbi:hypothetical protein CRYUN_Cryun11dG0125000 [Craigia yunnanensis]
MAPVTLKALVDKTNNRVIFAESNEDFVDILFSFFTIPMGKIIKLTRNQSPAASVGCMNNLYESVQNLEVRRFQTATCRSMLLSPRNAAAVQCENLKLKLDVDEYLTYFRCYDESCGSSNYKLLSHYNNAICACGRNMHCSITLVTKKDLDVEGGGPFVKRLARLIISAELQIVPSSTAASFSILSKLGIMDGSLIEERSFDIGVDEALKLLKCSLVSKTPLTEVLLKNNPVPEPSEKDFEQGSFKRHKLEATSIQNGKIAVKLMISKSKQMVCYAEAGEDFVDLLFSFLNVPLGFIVKQMQGGNSKGCINCLYDSVQGLDAERYLKSPEKKAMLLSPKLAPGFSYENQLLGVEEDTPAYFYSLKPGWSSMLASDKTVIPSDSSRTVSVVTIMDPKSHDSHHNDKKSGQGFFRGPALFTITDDLIITAISSISGLSVLSKLKVPFGDIEERTVHVGKNEALRLLIASLISKSALTNTFLLMEPKQEFGGL